MIRALLAIDPGSKRTGIAVLGIVSAHREPLLIWVGHHDPKTDRQPFSNVIRSVMENASSQGYSVDTVAIEDQFVKKNVRSALVLARTAGRWVEACAVAGFEVELVPASTWQAAALKRLVPTVGGRASRDDLKATAVRHASRLWGVTLGQDEADAALLGRFVVIRDEHTAMVRGARRR